MVVSSETLKSSVVALRVADSLLIPLNLTQYGQDLSQYLAK